MNTTGPIRRTEKSRLKNLTVDGYLKSVGLVKYGNMFNYPDDHMVDKYINTNGNINNASGWDSIGVFEIEPETDYAVYDNASGITYILIGVYSSSATTTATCVDPRLDHTSITNGYTFKTPTGVTHLVITVDNNSSNVNIPTIVLVEGNTNKGKVNHFYRLDSSNEYGWSTRFKDLYGLLENNQITDNEIDRGKFKPDVVDDLLRYSEKYYIRKRTKPLNTNLDDIYNNAVIGFYDDVVNVDYGTSDDLFSNIYKGGTVNSESLKRVYNSDLDVYYDRPNAIRLNVQYQSSGASVYYPSFNMMITNDDLKKIGIDVSSTGYTTKYVDVRTFIGNYVGWNASQFWISLCYTHEPSYYISGSYTFHDVMYVYHTGEMHPNNSDIESNNTGKTFIVSGETITEHNFDFKQVHNIPIYKDLSISDTGTTLEFKGMLLQYLGYSSNDNSELERGFDIHSVAVVNKETFSYISPTTNVKNLPGDIILYDNSLSNLSDVDASGITNGNVLIYDDNQEKWITSGFTIDKLGDTNITNLQDGEQLLYSGSTGKWVNVPQGSQYMPAEPDGLLYTSENMFNYPDDHMVDKYIGTTGNISNASGWDSIGTFVIEPETDYAVYDNSSGLTYILIGVYNSSTTNSSTCVDPRLAHSSITNGYTFTTPTGVTHLVITVDNSHSDVYIPTINLIKGNSNEGDKKSLYRLNRDIKNGWFVRSEDLEGEIMKSQLNSGVTQGLLTNADKWQLRDVNEPLNPSYSDNRNAVIGFYSSEVDVQYGTNYMINFNTSTSATSTLKRVYDSDISTYYQRPNLIRLKSVYDSAGASVYYPSLVIKIDNDKLKDIGIDISSSGYTTKLVNIRIAIENYVGWVGHQLWLTLCYVHEPNYYDHYTTSEVTYTHANSVRHPLDSDIETDNTGLDFTTTGSTESDNGITFQYFNGVNINKNVIIDSTSYEFKGLIIHILGSGSNDSNETTRGFDFHSVAVVNDLEYDTINASTDLRNRPDDLKLSSIEMKDIKDIDLSVSPTNSQILVYSATSEKWTPQTLDSVQKVTVQNSDKIAFFGSSYTESAYAVKNKSWVNKIAQMTDWIMANMGQSGNRLTDEVERLRNNDNRYHSTVGIKELAPTLISFANIGNETLDNLSNLDMYRQELLYAYQHVKSIGAEMIIGSEHITNSTVEMLMYGLGEELGVLTCPIGVVGSRVLSTGYPGFWGGGHPATRTNAHSFIEWMYFIDQLPRPKKSIKLFRVRSEYKNGSPTYLDLGYDTILQRHRYFQEIGSGENSLNETDGQGGWEYYDRLDENFDIVNQINEYCNIIAGTNVSFSNYALIEIVIDRLNPSFVDIYIKVGSNVNKVYLANNNDPNTKYDENRNGDAFQVTKDVYISFSGITTGTTFTSDATGTGTTLTYTGQVKGAYLDGYWLFFNSQESAVNGGSGYLSGNTQQYEYIKCDSKLGRHKIDLFERWENNWSNFEEYSGYTYSSDTNYIKISLSGDFKEYVQYDKIRLLLENSGSTINISDIYANYNGGEQKRQVINPKFKIKRSFKELNTYIGFNTDWDTNGGWSTNSVSGATLVTIPSSLEDYPPINSVKKHIELGFDTDGFSQYIEKTFDIDKSQISSKGLLKVIIRVVARLYPKIFNTTVSEDSYHTQTRQITKDSYDDGTLVCLVDTDNNKLALMKKLVDIGWSEIYFETYLSKEDVDSFKVRLYRDEQDRIDIDNYRNHTYPLQVYDVSVQIEGQIDMPDIGDDNELIYKDSSKSNSYNSDSGLTWVKTLSGNTLNINGDINIKKSIINNDNIYEIKEVEDNINNDLFNISYNFYSGKTINSNSTHTNKIIKYSNNNIFYFGVNGPISFTTYYSIYDFDNSQIISSTITEPSKTCIKLFNDNILLTSNSHYYKIDTFNNISSGNTNNTYNDIILLPNGNLLSTSNNKYQILDINFNILNEKISNIGTNTNLLVTGINNRYLNVYYLSSYYNIDIINSNLDILKTVQISSGTTLFATICYNNIFLINHNSDNNLYYYIYDTNGNNIKNDKIYNTDFNDISDIILDVKTLQNNNIIILYRTNSNDVKYLVISYNGDILDTKLIDNVSVGSGSVIENKDGDIIFLFHGKSYLYKREKLDLKIPLKTEQLILKSGNTYNYEGGIKYDNNSIWLNTGGTSNDWVNLVKPIRHEMTAIGGETGFTISNNVDDRAMVFINGSLQFSDDYTLSGSTIEFDSSLSVSDRVVVINYI